jgi:hypothetical protein
MREVTALTVVQAAASLSPVALVRYLPAEHGVHEPDPGAEYAPEEHYSKPRACARKKRQQKRVKREMEPLPPED